MNEATFNERSRRSIERLLFADPIYLASVERPDTHICTTPHRTNLGVMVELHVLGPPTSSLITVTGESPSMSECSD